MKPSILNWLTVLLIALKLFNFINISWWAVFTPTYIWLGIIILLLVIFIILFALAGFARYLEEKNG